MKILLWILQVLLAALFAFTGFVKLVTPKEEMLESAAWVEPWPAALIVAIGVAEIAGALGLILPALTGILEVLTPLAAVGLAVTMVGAVITHIAAGEANVIAMPAILGVVLALVAWGRFRLLSAKSDSEPTSEAAPASAQ